ncbi:hypothetical protein VTN02DRAFT_3131 [Thermoascus thermophilus]
MTLSHSSLDTSEATNSSPFARKPARRHFSQCLSSTLSVGRSFLSGPPMISALRASSRPAAPRTVFALGTRGRRLALAIFL